MKPIEIARARQKRMQEVVEKIKPVSIEHIQLPKKKGDKTPFQKIIAGR